MKKLFILLLFLLPAAVVSAQEPGEFSAAIGLEGNNNAFKGGAFGVNAYGLYGITKNLAVGLKCGASFYKSKEPDNTYLLTTYEPQAMLRYWFESVELLGFNMTPYGQADLGVSMKTYRSSTTNSFLGGLTVGLRIPIESIYIEPYLRDGYPFKIGGGIAFGYSFK